MVKTIKFHLNLNGNKVINLEDLKDNFDIQDMLFYLDEGIFKRWIELLPNSEEKENINKIIEKYDKDQEIYEKKEIMNNLIKEFGIFKYELDFEKVFEIYDRKFIEFDENKLKISPKSEILEKFFQEYSKIKDTLFSTKPFLPTKKIDISRKSASMLATKEKFIIKELDFSIIKEKIRAIDLNYKVFFRFDLNDLFKIYFKEQCIIFLYLLTNFELRKILLENSFIVEELGAREYELYSKEEIFKSYNKLNKNNQPFKIIENILPGELVELKNNLVMVILVSPEIELHGINQNENSIKKYKEKDINGSYLILRDVEYKNTGRVPGKIIYMEV